MAQQCPSDQYFDYGSRQCRARSGNYTAPASCAPGQFYDHYKQACMSPPPRCEQNQYYDHEAQQCKSPEDDYGGGDYGGDQFYGAPPPRSSCPPEDRYCRPPPPPECGKKLNELRYEMESMMQSFGDAMAEFQQEFDQARKEFFSQKPTREESQAFNEKWRREAEAVGSSFHEKYQAFIQSRDLGDCAQYLPPPPMGGGFGGPGSRGEGGPPEHYQRGPPQGDRYYEENEAVRAIRDECEQQMRKLFGEEDGPRGPGGNATGTNGPGPSGPGGDPEKREQAKKLMRECEKRIREHFQEVQQDEEHEEEFDENFGSFAVVFDEDEETVSVAGRFLSLVGDGASQIISEVSCGGQEVLEALSAEGYFEEFEFEEEDDEGSTLEISAGGSRVISFHDNPRCTINLATSKRSVEAITLDFADYWDMDKKGDGYTFTDGELQGKILVHKGKLTEGEGINEFQLKGKATLMVSKSSASEASSSSLLKDEDVQEALEEGDIGAEVVVALDDGVLQTEATPYGDLDVLVEQGEEDQGISATFSSETHDGKTIVMAFAKDIFDSIELDVSAFEVDEDEESEEAIDCVREAKNLQDVLDPNDDDECIEWWVVEDKNGVQTLVSIYGFSTKRVEIQSVASSALGGIPGFGLAALALGVLAAVGIVAVRARKDP